MKERCQLLDPDTEKKLVKWFYKTAEEHKIDESHGLQHCFSTMSYTHVIIDDHFANEKTLIKGMDQERAALIINISAFVHDSVDDKYIGDKMEEARKSLKRVLQSLKDNLTKKEITIIFDIIDNMSFSKRKTLIDKGKDINLGENQLALEIARDGDLLEGFKISRCEQYSIHKLLLSDKELDTVVYNLMATRVILYRDKYISTKCGKKLAKTLHEILKLQLEL